MTGKPRKIFVLDTSVILFDASAVYNLKEHDVAIPITVLEELDHFKKGDNVINLQAREFIRQLVQLTENDMVTSWMPLGRRGPRQLPRGHRGGRLARRPRRG